VPSAVRPGPWANSSWQAMAAPGLLEVLSMDSWDLVASQHGAKVALGGGEREPSDFGAKGLTAEGYMHNPSQRSPWHDVRLRAQGLSAFNFVVEVPWGTLCKQEVALGEPWNPIGENDRATKKLQAFAKPVPFNYGIFPQTYCHPEDKTELGVGGDAAPLDAVELSGEPLIAGHVHEVEIVGAFCVVDKSELDWKVFTVRSETLAAWGAQLGPLLLGVKLRREIAGAMQWFCDWYDFKSQGSNKVTKFPYGRELFPKAVALHRLSRAHGGWLRLFEPSSPSGLWLSDAAKRQLEAAPGSANKKARTSTA